MAKYKVALWLMYIYVALIAISKWLFKAEMCVAHMANKIYSL